MASRPLGQAIIADRAARIRQKMSHPSRVGQQPLAGRCQCHAPPVTAEQGFAEIRLKQADGVVTFDCTG